MNETIRTILVAAAVVIMSASTVPQVYAQETGANATSATQAAPVTKAEKKAARKEARAKKNAELKKLEDAGYNPAKANDPNYPQDLQNAQKKARVGASASQ
ncbi:hypothetical protein AWB68_04975 [Caballeronia choica]|jgi:hypothetical protein|uniref:Purine nucleoside phosphorylase n=2 Tax=Caballeronia choica TaxID=326476 RepID=A0A158K768_9BURK|nr:hypothetical protein AWB68_04975 [Caballeronia choica]